MLLKALVLSFCYIAANAVVYNSYTGEVASQEELAAYNSAGITASCTIDVDPCDPDDWSRVDGSCNNLDHITTGAYHTRQIRLLDANFNTANNGFEPRLTKSGKPLDPARYLRLNTLTTGFAMDEHFAQTMPYWLEFLFNDFGSGHDTFNYVFNIPYCCEERGKTEPMCAPNVVRDDDMVHQFTDIRCMNMTRPMSFQNIGCVRNDTVPDRIDFTTTFWDLSNVYYYSDGVISRIRTFDSGLLKVEVVNGNEFPSDANETTTCFIKQAIETGCSRDVPNALIGNNMLTTMFWRLHNSIARKLAEMNPHWDDNTLFFTTRDICIAIYNQITYYELWPLLFGPEYFEAEGIISQSKACSDQYDPDMLPQVVMESSYIMRYFHTIQTGFQEIYDENNEVVQKTPIIDYIFRVQDLTVNNTFSSIVDGMTKQSSGGFDKIVDAIMSNKGLGSFQKAFDITTNDLAKGRYFGFQPYIKYRELCTNKTYTSWDDLRDVMTEENIDVLKYLYVDIENVELMAGVDLEEQMENGYLPPTVACILAYQLKRGKIYDRHWYERCNRPHAFTEDQLMAIRNASLARFICDTNDAVTHVQPEAFLKDNNGNDRVPCDQIPMIDLTAWQTQADDVCA